MNSTSTPQQSFVPMQFTNAVVCRRAPHLRKTMREFLGMKMIVSSHTCSNSKRGGGGGATQVGLDASGWRDEWRGVAANSKQQPPILVCFTQHRTPSSHATALHTIPHGFKMDSKGGHSPLRAPGPACSAPHQTPPTQSRCNAGLGE